MENPPLTAACAPAEPPRQSSAAPMSISSPGATKFGTRKIPAPMMIPTTIESASRKPNRRGNSAVPVAWIAPSCSPVTMGPKAIIPAQIGQRVRASTKQLTVDREPCKLAALLYRHKDAHENHSLNSIDRGSFLAFSADIDLPRQAPAYR